MANLKYTISIKGNSNRIISSSEDKFIGIRNGSLIKIGDDSNLYTVQGRDNFFFIKNFSVSDTRTIIINEDIDINLQLEDVIKITYKEYELVSIFDIIDGGINYNVGDLLTVNGGITNIDISSGSNNPSILEVKEVDSYGKILTVGISQKGKYLTNPENPITVFSKDGANAKFDLKYDESSNRTIMERTIININKTDNKTYLTLDYSLPLNLKQGKLSVEKYVLLLNSNYSGGDVINSEYKIYKDFTPNVNIPLMAKNSISQDIIFNRAMQLIDKELKSIKDKINLI